jgi:hypothetical protein
MRLTPEAHERRVMVGDTHGGRDAHRRVANASARAIMFTTSLGQDI